jgi:hypothetical protein
MMIQDESGDEDDKLEFSARKLRLIRLGQRI